jgi:hypothetical protein
MEHSDPTDMFSGMGPVNSAQMGMLNWPHQPMTYCSNTVRIFLSLSTATSLSSLRRRRLQRNGLILHGLKMTARFVLLTAGLSAIEFVTLCAACFAATVVGSAVLFLAVEKRFSFPTPASQSAPAVVGRAAGLCRGGSDGYNDGDENEQCCPDRCCHIEERVSCDRVLMHVQM